MGRPLLSLWQVYLILPLQAACAVGLLYPPIASGTALLVLMFIPWFWWNWSWLIRFTCKVWRFRTVSGSRVVIHYAPELANRWDFAVFQHSCEAALDEFASVFGRPLRGRVVVYLFARCEEIGRIFGKRYGGLALSFGNVVAIADDNSPNESVRHEIAHLFCARWMANPPPLLSEGLPTWLQKREWSGSEDDQARFLPAFPESLRSLLRSRDFFSDMHRNYIIAGSFTGFLLRHYGWKQYRKLYKLASVRNFSRSFAEVYGMPLDRAETLWRNELLAMPALKRRLEQELCA